MGDVGGRRNEMNNKSWINAARVISNVVYGIGVLIVLCLGVVGFFGSNEAIYPDAMIPYSWRNGAFFCLVFGTLPMLLASMAVYKFNAIKNSAHKVRNLLLIFLPGFICSVCALVLVGFFIFIMANSLRFIM